MADYQAVSMSSLLSPKVPAARCAVVLAAAGLMLAACSSATSSAPGGSSGSAPMTSPGGSGGGGGGGGGGGNSNGSGASTLFPYAAGDTWVYNVSLGTSGHGTATNKIVAVTPVSDGNKVTMTVTDKI